MQSAVYKVALTNTQPTAVDTIWSDIIYPPPAAANGYPPGGATPAVMSAVTNAGQFKLVLQDTIFTAGSGGIGPFRFVVLYDSSAGNKVVGFYDYGVSISLNQSDTFTLDFDQVNGVLTLV